MYSDRLHETGLIASEAPFLDNSGLTISSGTLEVGVMAAETLYPEHYGGRFQSFFDGIRGFVTEKRLAFGTGLAVLALSLAGCQSPAGRTSTPEAGDPAATASIPQSTTATKEASRTIKPEFRPGEQEELANVAGWEKDAILQMAVLERFHSIESEIVILGLDDFKPPESLVQELKAAINLAEIVGGRKPNITAKSLRLGQGTTQDVNYQVTLSKSGTKAPDRRFVVFTAGQEGSANVIPTNTPQGGYTRQTSKGITATILPNSPNVDRDAFVEAFRMTTTAVIDPALKQAIEGGKFDANNLQIANVADPTPTQRINVLRLLLEQREATSWADARESAYVSASYDSFAAAVVARPVIAFASVGVMRYPAPAPEQYQALAFPTS